MSDKYRVPMNTKLNHPGIGMHHHTQEKNPAHGMDRVAEGVVDVAKVAVVGSVAMGIAGQAGNLVKK